MSFIKKCKIDNVPAISGQSAFFLLLSIIPFIMLAVSVLSILGRGEVIHLPDELINYTGDNVLVKLIKDTIINSTSSTSIITAVISLWTAGRGLYIITEGINRIYKLPDKKIWLIKRVFAMGYTLVLMVIMIIFFFLLLVELLLSAGLATVLPFTLPRWIGPATVLLFADGLMILFMTLSMKFYLLGKVSNKRYTKFRVLLPGSVITVAAWNIYILGMQIYTTYFGTSSVYGSLGTVAVFMMMIYFMMYILLCGIEVNYIYKDVFLSFRISNLFKKKDHNPAKKRQS